MEALKVTGWLACSEELIGKVLKDPALREKVFVATK